MHDGKMNLFKKERELRNQKEKTGTRDLNKKNGEYMKKNCKKVWKFVFLVYILILIKLIVFKYPWEYLMDIVKSWEKGVVLEGLATANFTLGKSIRMYIKYFNKFPFWNGFANLAGNILVFIPFGFLMPKAYPKCGRWWRVFYCAIGFVMCIELFQLFSAFGAFDVDDILLNVLGSVIGYSVFAVMRKVKIRIRAGRIYKKM